MSRVVRVTPVVYARLQALKTEFKLKSVSEVVRMLLAKQEKSK